jgi:Tfp pilus assembly protein PilF
VSTRNHIRASLTCGVLIATLSVCAPCSGQVTASGDAFTEAQRYHLGIDRPRDAKKAEQFYKTAIRQGPGNTDAIYNLAHLYFIQMRYDLAAKTYRKVLKLNPEDSDAYNNLGTVYERQGRVKSARKLYVLATKAKQPVATAFYNLARLYLKDGEEDRARAAIEKAMELEPENDAFVKLHSRLLSEVGRLSNATIGYVIGGLSVTLVGGGYLLHKGKLLS